MIKFKRRRDTTLFSALHPILIMIFVDLYTYTKDRHNVELVVTQTVSNKFIDQKLKRKSPSHSEHRAIDIRTKDLDVYVLQDILEYINTRPQYQQYKYLSLSGEKRLAYFHIGSAEHIHLCIHSKFKI